MAFSYNPDLSDKVSEVRFTIQDVYETTAFFPDETIIALLDANGNDTLKVAATLAKALWVKYIQLSDVAEVDDIRVEYKEKATQFRQLFDELTKQSLIARSSGVLPIFFGGIDRAQFDNTRNDSTTVKPSFTKGGIQFDKQFPELYPVDEERYWPR
jgi:hypothetical protein